MASPIPPVPAATSVSSESRSKYIVIGVVAVAMLPVFLVGLLFNAYIFGGIDFPDQSFGDRYAAFWFVTVYGALMIAPVLAVVLVRFRRISWGWVIAILAVPAGLQMIATVLYSVLSDRYGVICC